MDFSLNGWAVSNRHIYDLSNWEKSLGSIVPGQSGMIGSPHYKDQVDLWRQVKHHPLYFSRDTVEKESAHVLELIDFDRNQMAGFFEAFNDLALRLFTLPVPTACAAAGGSFFRGQAEPDRGGGRILPEAPSGKG
jgi:hypothetical protein